VSHFKQAYQFQYNTNMASVEDSNYEFDINMNDGPEDQGYGEQVQSSRQPQQS